MCIALGACGNEAESLSESRAALGLPPDDASVLADHALAFRVRSFMLDGRTSVTGHPILRETLTPVVQPVPTAFDMSGGRRKPRLEQGNPLVTLDLPAKADEAFVVQDLESKVEIAVTLEGAAAVEGSVSKDLVVFPDALGPGATVFHSVRRDGGLEDFVLVPDERRSEISYQVSLRNVSGLRLFANTLEFLNASGDPRLRVAPPYVVDTNGVGRWASVTVEGCVYDTSEQSPWDHPWSAPGSSSCRVTVGWDADGLTYPLLVDPTWTPTISLAYKREGHAMSWTFVEEGVNRSLVCGGISVTGSFLSSCEKRNNSTHTFSSGPNLMIPRAYFLMYQLSETCPLSQCGSPEKIFVAGGWTATTPDIFTCHRYGGEIHSDLFHLLDVAHEFHGREANRGRGRPCRER